MYKTFLIKYAEIAIKGKNRYIFEDALVKNIKYQLRNVDGSFEVRKESGRVYVETDGDYDYDETVATLSRIFGIVGICPVELHEDEGFDKTNQRHADGGYSRRVGEYVYDDAHDKGNEQQCPSGAVTLKEHDKIDIEQGRGDTEEMDMIKYQYLHQQYHRV